MRISVFSSLEHHYLSLSTLCIALTNDPDLASVPREILPRLLQILFISTGCDYISGLGKCTFLKVFFQHAEFINSISLGTLCDTCSDSWIFGFLSFVRLVGTVYLKKHLSSFKYGSPRALFDSYTSSGPISQHKQWLESIRYTVWECIEFEAQLPPSWEVLWRYWLRCWWVAHFWSQAANNTYHFKPLSEHGWKVVCKLIGNPLRKCNTHLRVGVIIEDVHA